MPTDHRQNREAYKAVRTKVRNAMIQKKLDKPAILSIAKTFLSKNYPDAYVDLNDLCGACLYHQQAMDGEVRVYSRYDYE